MFQIAGYSVSVPLAVTFGVAVGALVIALVGLGGARSNRRRIQRLFAPGGGAGLEEGLAAVMAEAKRWPELEQRLQALSWQQRNSLSHTGLVRYNPFDDTGADLSFSLAVLTDEGDGLVLTSLWGRDEVRVYAKPVEHGLSRYPLSSEEKQALDLAVNRRLPAKSEQ